jgi:GTP cyclohydrolase I
MEVVVNAEEAVRRQGRVAGHVRHLLEELGEDPEREGLRETPMRVARMYEELLAGNDDDGEKLKAAVFDADGYDQMVVLTDIEFASLCEHHLLPFVGRAHVAYLPDKRVLGISKLARVVDLFARRLQIQERMTQQIAGFLQEALSPRGVGVVVEGRHACMGVRGVKKPQASMVTSALTGQFRERPEVRGEFLNLIRRQP